MRSRFQHVLIPVDFTTKNVSALDIGFELAAENRSTVTLLHVIESIEHDADAEIEAFYAKLEKRAQTELESMAQRFSDAGVPVEFKVRYGKRVREIVQFASDRSVDLIVMSSHAIDTNEPMRSWGTLSYQVSILCECPVLLVK